MTLVLFGLFFLFMLLGVPIAISLDNHANISLAMVELANAITVFRSYPHLDMDITGARVWPIMNSRKGCWASSMNWPKSMASVDSGSQASW